jgi:hypothetical protein
MPSTAVHGSSYTKYVSNELKKIMRKQMPDMLHLKPPTEHAVNKMIKNLHAAAKNSKGIAVR